MKSNLLLQNKTAVIYGAAGAIGSAVARTFAREGANVFLTGRNQSAVDALAREINSSGGKAEAAVVNALEEPEIEAHLNDLVKQVGGVDISFNAIGIPQKGIQGIPLLELSPESLALPVSTYTRSHFLTARAAARRMAGKGSGAILTLTATPARAAAPFVGGMAPAWAAVEALTRTLASELGPRGIRVVCLRSDAIPETATITEVFGLHGRAIGIPPEQFLSVVQNMTLLKRLPRLAEIAEAAAFLTSDRASAMTGTVANLSCGSIAD